jgi:hypothetical protein
VKRLGLLASVVLLPACAFLEDLDDLSGPTVEEAYRAMRPALQAAVDAVPLVPALPVGPPTYGECRGGFGEETGDVDVTYDLWVPYETPEEAAELREAVARAWRDRGLEVSPFPSGLTVFPNGTEFRLDFDDTPESDRFHLHGQTSCLHPATGIPPEGIAGLGEDTRDLRGPTADPGATTRTAARWMSRLFAATAEDADADGDARTLPSGPSMLCYGFEPDLFGALYSLAIPAENVTSSLDRVERTWDRRGLELNRGMVAGADSLLATFGDFTFRARDDLDRERVVLHGTAPCLPKP